VELATSVGDSGDAFLNRQFDWRFCFAGGAVSHRHVDGQSFSEKGELQLLLAI